MKYITAGNYHINMGKFYTLDTRPAYKNYGKFDKESLKKEELYYGLSVKEVCEIWEKCGNHKYTYDENHGLKDFCVRSGVDNLAICVPTESCRNV